MSILRLLMWGMFGAVCLSVSQAMVIRRLPESALVSGLAVGSASRSFQPKTLFEAIDQTRLAGARVMEIQAGQALNPKKSDVLVGPEMLEPEVAELRRKISSSAARLVAARVRFSNNNSANTRLFQWADSLDIQILVGDPPLDQFDNLEKLIRRFNIGVAIETAPRPATGNRAGGTDPQELLELVRGRDPRFGIVLNVLNVVRAGVDPYSAITELRTRLLGIQVTDLNSLTPTCRPVPFGTGHFDFHRLLTQIDEERFDGYLVFDSPPETPEFKDDLQQGVTFLRTQMDAIRRANLLRMASQSVRVADGYSYEVVALGNIPEPIQVATCPAGGIWFASRRGYVWEWSESAATNRLVGYLPVVTSVQRGLYSFTFDPGFATNGFLYVYRAAMVPVGNSNRVSRYTATQEKSGWRIDARSERVLIEIPSAQHGKQQGGGLLLNPADGCLYIGVGDNSLPSETPDVFDDAEHPSQNPASLWGKVLRIRTDGSIPKDNPFVGAPPARPEVYAWGLRNPFTLAFDPATGRVYTGDVGYDRRQDHEEIDLLTAGANYGWPRCDGSGRDTMSGTPCSLTDAVAPWFSYPHESAAAVVLGPFVPKASRAASEGGWGNGFVYGDFARRTLRFAEIDPTSNTVTNTVPLVGGLAGGPASMAFTTRGELYLVEYAGWLAGNPADRLVRIVPAKQAPQAPPAAAVEN